MRGTMNEEYQLDQLESTNGEQFSDKAEIIVMNDTSVTDQVMNKKSDTTRDATNRNGSLRDVTDNTDTTSTKFLFHGHVICTYSFRIHTTLAEVKTKLADVIHEEIEIRKQGTVLDDGIILSHLGAVPLGTLELELVSVSGIDLSKVYRPPFIPTVDVIMVKIFEGKKQVKEFVVEIEKCEGTKSWLGGYRNKITKVVYHHATTQTEVTKRNQIPSINQSAQTPVFPIRESETNTNVDRIIQTHSMYIPEINDVLLKVSEKPYESYDDWISKNRIVDHVLKIQKWYRNIKDKTPKMQMQIIDHLSQYTEHHVYTKEELRKKLDTDIEDDNPGDKNTDIIKQSPSNRQDFDVLYMMIGKWWSSEVQRIRDIPNEKLRKDEYMKLLKKEIFYLSKLDRCRAESREKAMHKQLLCLLNKASKPKKMITTNNKEVSISTLETQRATILRNIYVKIIRRDVSTEERVAILKELSNTLTQCEGVDFVENIQALIQKEIDQMYVGVPKKNLEMTRTRIELLFSKLINFPEYNKSSKGDIRMSGRSKRLTTPEKRYYTCSRCNRTLPVSEYPSGAHKTVHRICNSCEWVENVGSKRIDLKPYKGMLKSIQKRELDKNATTSLCFGMQASGMYYLVNIIWDGHSAISERSDIASLQCIRWNRTQEWAPWNCIVLTTEEADLHENICDVNEFYSDAFVNKVTLRHIAARIQFLSLREQEGKVEFTGAFGDLTTDANVLLDKTYVTNFMTLDGEVH